ncbi:MULTISPECIES: ATP-binding protein [Agrobacterium]|uniref:histidine kinase n=1 Tax=Agrobacterium burrii TaxID=2815339 RepID=A0ABS3ELQ4_9HYPH|nr:MULTISPECIES: ATP-binding protein [Agrobacterium]MBO0132917.1 HAMP domain-containing protein [Agrobacterium burrii]
MKRLLPQSLFGQTLLILLAGLLASHLIGTWIYSADRGQIVRAVGGFAIAQRITNLTRLVRDAPAEWRDRITQDSSDETFNVALSPEPPPAILTDSDTSAAEALKQVLIERLSLHGSSEPRVSASRPRGMMAGMAERMIAQHGMGETPMMSGFGSLGPFAGFRELQVAIPVEQGQWLTFKTVLPESGGAFSLRFLVSMGMMAAITVLVTIWVVRRVSSPLTALSKAALRLGEDLNAPPMLEVGTVETRQAARAFNAMQARLRGMIDDRTKMLAAISHDFRTPLTLLRLRVENVEDAAEREKMLSTIADLNKMVATTLEFASGATQQPVRRPTDLAALIESMTDDLSDAGLPVVCMDAAQPIIYACDPATLKRALTNLIDNAVKYGGRAELAIHETPQTIEIMIDDAGPGIPEEELTHVFEPLYRLESSRSRETGGMGLGLAIALSIIRTHGGQLTLSNRAEGGLRALIYFPRAEAS